MEYELEPSCALSRARIFGTTKPHSIANSRRIRVIFSERLSGCSVLIIGRSPKPTITSIGWTKKASSISFPSSSSCCIVWSVASYSISSGSSFLLSILKAANPVAPERRKKGSLVDQPGNAMARSARTTEVMAIGGILANTCAPKPLPKSFSDVAPLVTTIPAAVEIINAGICETNPSPMVRIVKVFADWLRS